MALGQPGLSLVKVREAPDWPNQPSIAYRYMRHNGPYNRLWLPSRGVWLPPRRTPLGPSGPLPGRDQERCRLGGHMGIADLAGTVTQ